MWAADGDSCCREMHVMRCALQVAKQLADCVIPNEYGIDPGSKIRIGSKICCALLGKLLADLSNMQEESIATAVRCAVTAGHALLSGCQPCCIPCSQMPHDFPSACLSWQLHPSQAAQPCSDD